MNFKLLTKEISYNEDPESPVVKKIKAASQLSWSEILLSLPLQLCSHAPVFFSMKDAQGLECTDFVHVHSSWSDMIKQNESEEVLACLTNNP